MSLSLPGKWHVWLFIVRIGWKNGYDWGSFPQQLFNSIPLSAVKLSPSGERLLGMKGNSILFLCIIGGRETGNGSENSDLAHDTIAPRTRGWIFKKVRLDFSYWVILTPWDFQSMRLLSIMIDDNLSERVMRSWRIAVGLERLVSFEGRVGCVFFSEWCISLMATSLVPLPVLRFEWIDCEILQWLAGNFHRAQFVVVTFWLKDVGKDFYFFLCVNFYNILEFQLAWFVWMNSSLAFFHNKSYTCRFIEKSIRQDCLLCRFGTST